MFILVSYVQILELGGFNYMFLHMENDLAIIQFSYCLLSSRTFAMVCHFSLLYESANLEIYELFGIPLCVCVGGGSCCFLSIMMASFAYVDTVCPCT